MGCVNIRRSSAEDLPLVKIICVDLYDGQDYVPYMWGEWASSPENQLYLLEVENQPAAVYCLRLGIAGPGTSWVQGVRVAAAFRGRGLAKQIIEHAIQISRELECSVLGYTTAEFNAPMHHLAQLYRFRHIGSFLVHYKSSLSLSLNETKLKSYKTANLSQLEQIHSFVISSVEYKVTESFYANSWLWKPLSRELLAQHLEQGEVFSLSEQDELKAVAIISKEADLPQYWLSFISGEEKAAHQLLTELLQELIQPQPDASLNAQPAETPLTKALLSSLNFTPDPEDAVMWLYEFRL